MEFVYNHALTLVVFLPVLLGLGIFLIPGKESIAKVFAIAASIVVFLLSAWLFTAYDAAKVGFQFQETVSWIPLFGISYSLGMDGVSLLLVVLTTFLTPVVLLGAWNAVDKQVRSFLFLLLALETGMLGAFLSLDIVLFYVFWEAMLIPMYFLIGIWGGKSRIYASMKFFLYTLVGSLLMLTAIFYLLWAHHVQFGQFSANIADLLRVKVPFAGWASPQGLLFLAFSLAFAIKVPLFPLHTWLPDAHVEAPTAGSVILAGVLLKLGGYGFIRFAFPLFPQAVHYFAPMFMTLGAIAVVYGAWVAMVQPDIKKLVAYSSVSHMGFVIIGLFSLNELAVAGSVYQMLNHGISTGALFLIVGMLYERRHTREIAEFGGICRVMPIFAVVFLIVTLSSIALPSTNGFVGEFLILLGTFQVDRWIAGVTGTGVIFGAVYMLWMFQRVMFGPVTKNENKTLQDLSAREILVMAPMIAAIFFMGVFPNFFLSKMDVSVKAFLSQMKG